MQLLFNLVVLKNFTTSLVNQVSLLSRLKTLGRTRRILILKSISFKFSETVHYLSDDNAHVLQASLFSFACLRKTHLASFNIAFL